jgi:transposase
MAMGKRKSEQTSMWVPITELPVSPGHPFYAKLNALLEEASFDRFAETECQQFYAPVMGRPSLPPGRYFRLLLVGYFEGLDSERGIAWRAADSLAVRQFVGLGLDTVAPDHSTISRTRRLIALEAHRAVFTWVQERLAAAGLLKGRTVAIDATTLEANAAMRSIVRRDTGETYQEFLTRLATASGITTPTREALTRLDRRRKKRTSNTEWHHPSDPDAKITKMKDGRTHLAHKAEHAIDLDSGALVAVTLHGADVGDTTSLGDTVVAAIAQAAAAQAGTAASGALTALVADKGYHSNQTMVDLDAIGVRSYIAEPNRGRRQWTTAPDAQRAVYGNRRRVRGGRGQRWLRRRGEYVERSFAHVYDTGGMRRTHLRGHRNILKRLLVHASAFNLGRLMRQLCGRGTPRGLQGRRLDARSLHLALLTLSARFWMTIGALLAHGRRPPPVWHSHPAWAIA